jgi:hypothetical protein
VVDCQMTIISPLKYDGAIFAYYLTKFAGGGILYFRKKLDIKNVFVYIFCK